MENLDSKTDNRNITRIENNSSDVKSEAAPSKLKEFFKIWILYRLPTLLAMSWGVLKISSYKLPIEIRIENYLIVPFLVVFGLFILTGHWLRAVGYIPYLIFFPLLFVILPIFTIIRLWKNSFTETSLPKVIADFVRFIRSVKAIILLFLIVPVFWLATIFSSSSNFTPIYALTAHIAAYLLFLQSFRWASNPYKPILFMLDFLSGRGRDFFRKTYIDNNLKKDTKERNDSINMCNQLLNAIDKLYQPEAPLRRGLTAITHGNLSSIFTIVIVLIYGLLATSFSLTLYEIERAWGKIIQGLGDTPTRITYFYFSFLSQATAVPDDIKPLNVYGELWIIWHVMTGLLLLTGLITLFTSSTGIHSDSTLSEISKYFNQMKNDLVGWRNELQQPIIDVEVKETQVK